MTEIIVINIMGNKEREHRSDFRSGKVKTEKKINGKKCLMIKGKKRGKIWV